MGTLLQHIDEIATESFNPFKDDIAQIKAFYHQVKDTIKEKKKRKDSKAYKSETKLEKVNFFKLNLYDKIDINDKSQKETLDKIINTIKSYVLKYADYTNDGILYFVFEYLLKLQTNPTTNLQVLSLVLETMFDMHSLESDEMFTLDDAKDAYNGFVEYYKNGERARNLEYYKKKYEWNTISDITKSYNQLIKEYQNLEKKKYPLVKNSALMLWNIYIHKCIAPSVTNHKNPINKNWLAYDMVAEDDNQYGFSQWNVGYSSKVFLKSK